MPTYSVMLEGQEEGKGYLVTVEVSALDEERALSHALEFASDMQWDIVATEELSLVESENTCDPPKVTRLLGRAFFEHP